MLKSDKFILTLLCVFSMCTACNRCLLLTLYFHLCLLRDDVLYVCPCSTQWGCGLYQAVLCECLPAEGNLLKLGGGVPALSSRGHPQCHTALVPGHRRRHLRRAPHPACARQWHAATVPLFALCLQQLHPRQWLLLHRGKPGRQDPQPQHSHQSRWVEWTARKGINSRVKKSGVMERKVKARYSKKRLLLKHKLEQMWLAAAKSPTHTQNHLP